MPMPSHGWFMALLYPHYPTLLSLGPSAGIIFGKSGSWGCQERLPKSARADGHRTSLLRGSGWVDMGIPSANQTWLPGKWTIEIGDVPKKAPLMGDFPLPCLITRGYQDAPSYTKNWCLPNFAGQWVWAMAICGFNGDAMHCPWSGCEVFPRSVCMFEGG